jgi:tRNA-splicing ligase RtcB
MNLKNLGFLDIDHEKLSTTNTPYTIYAEVLDEMAQRQFYEVLNEPYVTYGALMPDAHSGYSMPIGGVCATKDTVVPQFVGFDIGCGMCAYKTKYHKEEVESHAEIIYEHIVEKIPLGFKKHKNHQALKIDLERTDFAEHILQTTGLKQVGTLGGGNHFIELGYGADDSVWIVVHSGSRGVGHKIASHYMLEAYLAKNTSEERLTAVLEDFSKRNENFKRHNPQGFEKALKKFATKQKLEILKKQKLDHIKEILPLDTQSPLGKDYITDQNFALAFALENRKRMIVNIHHILNDVLGGAFTFEDSDEATFINRNHNHAEYDEKREEWIHRKGATQANKGLYGVIPANMRDGSFIVRGKGAEASLNSSSHGAGRVMSRKKAKANISMEEFEESMKGIRGTVDENTLDESPFAYKDIFEVMRLQEDLLEVMEHIKVIINVKDSSKMRY